MIAAPLEAQHDQRLVLFTPTKEAERLEAATVVPASRDECRRFGTGMIALKGRMLELLGNAVLAEGLPLLDRMVIDDSPSTILAALD